MQINTVVIQIIILAVLFLVIGYLFGKLYDKRRNDIIKLLIEKDLLPTPATNTSWLDGGVCYMSDGGTGKVSGTYCERITVI
jgi:hypothetical protein